MNILLTGGGTGGSVSPLLAVAEEIKNSNPKARFLFVGTKDGVERNMAEGLQIPFTFIPAGKFRRYFSWKNFITPFLTISGFFVSLKIIKEFKPSVVFGTGSFVQVPVIWAAWYKGVPVVIHQQDAVPSLANKLCAWCSQFITVTFEHSVKDFSSGPGIFYKKEGNKVIWTGNPFRKAIIKNDRAKARKEFNIREDLPCLLVTGGGTGANAINNLIADAFHELTKYVQIIHQTGKGKHLAIHGSNYQSYEFIANMAGALAAADIVIARAGLSTLTELSVLGKVSIIVPMPNTHQEQNAEIVRRAGAAIVLDQNSIRADILITLVRKILINYKLQQELEKNMGNLLPKDSTKKVSNIIVEMAA